MCGIFGVLSQAPRRLSPALIGAAHAVQGHRGPDGRGNEEFIFDRHSLVLAHQRLAIIDLSEGGHQPMSYGQGQGSIVYNGELYNYLEIREELRSVGVRFSTESDTEVLLAALHQWGPEKALSTYNWMGAFAWLDRANQRLILARDPGSEKPLYYFCGDDQFIFASEIKTLLTLANRKFALDRDVIGRFLRQALTDTTPQSIFRDVLQVPASSFLSLDMRLDRTQPSVVQYKPPAYAGDAEKLTLRDCIEEVRRLFIDAVRVRLRSDVPVGVLLSGGIDSSSIAAVTHHLRGNAGSPQLLSAISEDPRFDETVHIEAMERHLGQRAEKVVLQTNAASLVDDLSGINWINDEPVSGLTALAHLRLMQAARERGLTVILSGQGADEAFLGYRKYLGFYLQSLLRQSRYAKAVKVLTGFIANGTIVNQFQLDEAKRYLPGFGRFRVARAIGAGNDLEGQWLRGWQRASIGLGTGSLAQRQMADIREFSVPALCHYEDRMSMAVGREIRLPFLDSRLIDLMLRVPDDFKLKDGWTKFCLRKAMQPYLPQEIAWRKDKKGFSNPQGEWLKSELRQPVRDTFGPGSLLSTKGILNSAAMLRKFDRYCAQPQGGGSIWYREIFAPFSLELWMRRYAAWIE